MQPLANANVHLLTHGYYRSGASKVHDSIFHVLIGTDIKTSRDGIACIKCHPLRLARNLMIAKLKYYYGGMQHA